MKLPFVRRRQRVSRGQAMVEFALILPILILLLLLAVDFGRVFFGWVAINNARRIAANEAAFHPDAWEGSGNAQLKLIYRNQVLQDLQSINCEPPAAVPGRPATSRIPPTSTARGNADHKPVRARGSRQRQPELSNSASSPHLWAPRRESDAHRRRHRVRRQRRRDQRHPGRRRTARRLPGQVRPEHGRTSVAAARAAWTTAGFTGAFTPSSGQDTETVTAQNTTPVSSPGSCLVATAVVTVTTSGPPGCSSPDITVPNLVGMTVSSARSTWYAAGFNNNTFTPNSRVGL